MEVKCAVCGKEFKVKPYRLKRCVNPSHICCSKICSNKLREEIFVGNNNPNKRYFFDENIFECVDNEFKAWFLGWIASDGNVSKSNRVTIKIHKRDINVLRTIQENFCKELPITYSKENKVVYCISSKKICNDICKLLKIEKKKKSDVVRFPDINPELYRHFIRGYFEGDGCIRKIVKSHRSPECNITSNSKGMLDDIQEKIGFNGYRYETAIVWSSENALDFLAYMYDGCKYYLTRKRDLYYDICCWQRMLFTSFNTIDKQHRVYFMYTDKNAVKPTKVLGSDTGYDITIIKEYKRFGDVVIYDTGIRVKPPFGYYFDLVPRSSISKTGYIMANCIGVIDMGYIGNIYVALRKVDKTAPDLQLPCRIAQLILRPVIHCDFVEVEELSKTERNDGGFGSTGIS